MRRRCRSQLFPGYGAFRRQFEVALGFPAAQRSIGALLRLLSVQLHWLSSRTHHCWTQTHNRRSESPDGHPTGHICMYCRSWHNRPLRAAGRLSQILQHKRAVRHSIAVCQLDRERQQWRQNDDVRNRAERRKMGGRRRWPYPASFISTLQSGH